MANERRDHLLLAVDNLIDVWNAWSASDVRYLTRVLEEAVEDALLVFADGAIPGDLRSLTARMLAVQEHWRAWNQKNDTSGGKFPVPDNAFWRALEDVEKARQAAVTPVRRSMETIEQLTAQKVTDAQICRMYGFTDTGLPDGAPQLWQLQEERANPGTHTSPETGWLPPHERRRQAQEAKQAEAVERIRQRRASKLKSLTQVAPEPIERLILEGVSGKQICRMKKIDQAALSAYCEEHSLVEPPWSDIAPNATRGDFDRDEETEDEPAAALLAGSVERPASPAYEDDSVDAEEPMTLEQEIVMYHKLGTMSPAQIAEAVSRDGNEVTRQKVSKVISRWEKEPEAFATPAVG